MASSQRTQRGRTAQKYRASQCLLSTLRAADSFRIEGSELHAQLLEDLGRRIHSSIQARWSVLEAILPDPGLSFEEWQQIREGPASDAHDPAVDVLLELSDWVLEQSERALYDLANKRPVPSVPDLMERYRARVEQLGIREVEEGLLVAEDGALVTEDGRPLLTEDGHALLVEAGLDARVEALALERHPDNTPYRGYTPTPPSPAAPQPAPARRASKRLRVRPLLLAQAIAGGATVVACGAGLWEDGGPWTILGTIAAASMFLIRSVKDSPFVFEEEAHEPERAEGERTVPVQVRIGTELPTVGGQADEDPAELAETSPKRKTK